MYCRVASLALSSKRVSILMTVYFPYHCGYLVLWSCSKYRNAKKERLYLVRKEKPTQLSFFSCFPSTGLGHYLSSNCQYTPHLIYLNFPLCIMRPGLTFELLNTSAVPRGFISKLYVRTLNHMYCLPENVALFFSSSIQNGNPPESLEKEL